MAELVRAALAGLGVDARVGEVPGEYCPGAFSVNAGGRVKLAGIGQRLIKGGAHVGCVIVAGGSEELRDVLVPVYEALGIDWDPATAGSVEDEVAGVTPAEVEAAILAELERASSSPRQSWIPRRWRWPSSSSRATAPATPERLR